MEGPRNAFLEQVASPAFCERLFARLPDVVFCLKDRNLRYQAANAAFSSRLGIADPRKLIGRTAEDFFPEHLAAVYRKQDLDVLSTGAEMVEHLELVTRHDGTPGWFLATKVPLRNDSGEIIGLASISRDLGTPDAEHLELHGLRELVEHIRAHLGEPLKLGDLAKRAGLSEGQLDRRMRRVFQLSPSAFVRKTRIEEAARLLTATRKPIVEIALACGYADQTSFTRQFSSAVGQPPAAYRDSYRRHG